MDKVLKWRDALEKAANLSGYDYSNKAGTEADSIEKLVQVILNKLDCKSSSNLKGLVEIEPKVEQIESLLCLDSPVVCNVGIWGMGGIGKTTLADVVYHRFSSKFEACCFLKNVRENSEGKDGIYNLRNKLLREIFDDESININTPSIGSELLKERLRRTQVLIVLDDVNDSRQLELLVGDDLKFGVGSRIIITTRDRSLLNEKVDDDKIYEVKGLKHDGALQLFHLHALKNKSPTTVYTEFSRKVIDYIQGIPLALQTLGALFRRCDTEEDWDEELNRLKKFPSKKVQNVLRLSYNGLEENEKECFLDIACFLKGADVYIAKRILDIRGFFGTGIQNLIDKSLISISKKNCLEMHDLLQEMGRTIVREQCRDEPGKRNRLWAADDVYQVLENDTGTSTVQCIFFDTSNMTRLELCGPPFKKMSNLSFLVIHDPHLRVLYKQFFKSGTELAEFFFVPLFGERYNVGLKTSLWLEVFGVRYTILDLCRGLQSLPNSLRYLYWQGYPLKSLPSNFSPQNLVELRLPYSFAGEKLWRKNQNLGNLKVIELSFCKHLTEVPDLSHCPKIEHIDLYGCTKLVRIPSYFKDLDKLRCLNLGWCTSLEFLPVLPVSFSLSLSHARTHTQAHLHISLMPFFHVLNNLFDVHASMLQEISDETLVSTICVGNQIPHWFCHQNKGSSITIKLPPDWYGTDFLGFAFSLVVVDNALPLDLSLSFTKIVCKCNFKTNSGESHEIIYPYFVPFTERVGKRYYSPSEFIFVWYSAFALGEGANLNRSTSFYKLVTEACFEFYPAESRFLGKWAVRRMVTKCGICLLYAQDVETIKLGGSTS
ncbi:hypothetical protein C1H46_018086 [Malus baccata]|uniref:ADP-ribosyl cyclase/cyclic ADP-ribose hydrolase n=1 Tax=Malus baccata TaxID=106549 RepID=A0A540MC48_MALBA|nr:hypothetical protein C1H46_018086 [Malus baccata]